MFEQWSRASALLVATTLVAGCNAASTFAAQNEQQAAGAPDRRAAPPKVPEVWLTREHAALCHVKVGDTLPKMELPALEGEPQQLQELYGKKATVVLFFTPEQALSRALLLDAGPDVQKPFGEHGVRVVGVAVGHTAASAREALADAKLKVPTLIDEDKSAFAKVAKKKLPRVYVVDAKGKILWFDLEYSEATRRELRQTLRAVTEP